MAQQEQTDDGHAFVPFVIAVSIVVTCVFSAFRVLTQGFLPDDDALVDAAKAITGRPWTDILVLKPEFSSDPHVAWHALLHVVALGTGSVPRLLVAVTVIALFALFCCAGLPWLRRAESWLLALIIVAGASTGIVERYVRGRPFIVSAVCLATMLLYWRRVADEKPAKRHIAVLTGLVAISALLHGSWYLWILPLAAFVIAGECAWARAVALAWVVGCVAAALLSMHPIAFPVTTFRMGLDAFGQSTIQRTLVAEFQPTPANVTGLFLIAFVFLFRKLYDRAGKQRPLHRDPAFVLAIVGWILGYKAQRFWGDWGLVGLLVVIATEADAFLVARISARSERRLWLALGLCVSFFLIVTNDVGGRWSSSGNAYRAAFAQPSVRALLPQHGGIVYSADMAAFYEGFFAFPDAQCRYVTGFEPTMMPDADYAVYRQIVANHGNPLGYAPWVARMGPDDRIVLRAAQQPAIPGVQWQGVDGVWIGARHLEARQ